MYKKAISYLKKQDKIMGKIIKVVGPIKLSPQKKLSPFETLVEAITYQQLTVKAATTIFNRVKGIYNNAIFPLPEDFLNTPDETLRNAGLSSAKVLAIKDLSQKTLDGVVPSSRSISHMNNEKIIERLISIRGIGRWTAEMLLIFKMGRMDILPVDDYGIRKGFSIAYKTKELPKPKELAIFGEKWRPYRTVASWYLWRLLYLPEIKRKF